MLDKHVPWLNNPIMAKLASALLAILTFVMAQREVPVLLDQAQYGALRTVGVTLWPLALVPWLVGMSGKRRLLGLFLGTSAGYLLMGIPLVGVLHGILLPNLDALPQVFFAILIGFFLLMAIEHYANRKWYRLLLLGAPVVGMCLLLIALHPVTVVLRFEQGELQPNQEDLVIVETYELQSEIVAAYTCKDVLIVVGQKEWLWRNPLGQTQTRLGSYDPRQVKVHCDGERLYIVEPSKGRFECYGYPNGELLWQRDDLGRITDTAWTTDYAWVLNCPDENVWPWPEEMEAVLHKINLRNGELVETKAILPPNNLFWKRPNYGALALLESTAEQAWIMGLSSPQKPIYREDFYYQQSEDDQAFIYRPAQGDLEELAQALPDGLSPFRNFDQPAYYLTGDLVVDVWPGYTYADSIICARSLVTGQVVWQQPLAKEYPPTLFAAQGKVMVDNEQGALCLDFATGSEYWSYPHQSQLRWVEAVGEDLLFGLANGTIVRMAADGQPLWQYAAQGFTNLDQVDIKAGTVTVRDSGIKDGEGYTYTLMGKYVTLSLIDGSVVPSAKPQLEGGNYAVSGEYLWYMKQFSYDPGPYNGAKAIYRLAGQRVSVRDLNMPREDILVRPGFLLIAEQLGSKARLSILRVKD